MWGLTDVVKFVHESGGDINTKDKNGLTPLNYALGQAGGFGFDGKSGVVARGNRQGDSCSWAGSRERRPQHRRSVGPTARRTTIPNN